MFSASEVTAAMQTFLQENGILPEVAALFTADLILENAREIPVPSIEVDAHEEVERSSSPVEEMEKSPSRSASPEEDETYPWPLVETTPMKNLAAAPKSCSIKPRDKYLQFFNTQPGWLEFFTCHLASSIVALYRLGREQDAMNVGQYAINFLGRVPLFTALEFYLSQKDEDEEQDGEALLEGIKQSLWEVKEQLRKEYCREQGEGLMRELRKGGLVFDAKGWRERVKVKKMQEKGGVVKVKRERKAKRVVKDEEEDEDEE